MAICWNIGACSWGTEEKYRAAIGLLVSFEAVIWICH